MSDLSVEDQKSLDPEEGAREKFQTDWNRPSLEVIGGNISWVFVESNTRIFARSRGENSQKVKS
jgi:hypothetical protein